MSSDLGRRVAVAAVGIPLGVALIWAGGWILGGVLALLAVAGAREVLGLGRARGWRPFPWIGIPAAGVLVILAVATGSLGAWASLAWGVLLVAVFSSLVAAVFLRGSGGDPLPAIGVTVLAPLYAGVPFAFALFLRQHPDSAWSAPGWDGTFLLFFPLVVTWVGDSAAYFGGRGFGRRKLLPSVSPAKTVEGGIAGLAGAMAAGGLFTLLLPFLGGGLPLTILAAALLGLLIGAVAQVGDLAESVLKREAGVKDSGRLLPGHGGVLDRFDAVLFTVPLTYALLPFFLGWGR
jgi:phosphatidate cytidylyltransferase